jgi:hypothetical protein
MSVVSGRVLCHFYMLRRKSKCRKPSQVSKYTFKCDIKLPSFCNFTWSLSLDIGHNNHFSNQSPQIIYPQLIRSLLCVCMSVYLTLFLRSVISYYICSVANNNNNCDTRADNGQHICVSWNTLIVKLEEWTKDETWKQYL